MNTKRIIFYCLLVLISMPMIAQSTFENDIFTTKHGKKLKITFIKHASLMMEYNNKVIYIDPVSEISGIDVDYSQLPKADLLIIKIGRAHV